MLSQFAGKFPKIGPPRESKFWPERPEWSVVVPVFKRHEWLERCLKSVWDQKHPSMEVLVISAGGNQSEDIRCQAALRHEPAERRAIALRFDDDLGPSGNWNRAISFSRGHKIHLLHDDDYVLPGFYERMDQLMSGDDTWLVMASCGYENVNDANEVIFANQNDRNGVPNCPDIFLRGNPLNPPAVVFTRSVYETIGGYSDCTFLDWEFYLRATAHCRWLHTPEILARYRDHNQPTPLARMRGHIEVLNRAKVYLSEPMVNEAKAELLDTLIAAIREVS